MPRFTRKPSAFLVAAAIVLGNAGAAHADPGDGAEQHTTIDHEDGSSSSVTTDSQGSRVENSDGSGSQYGRGWSHEDVVDNHRDEGSTTSHDDPDPN